METILSLNNVSKTFKQQQALSNVTMSIKKGDIYGLIGRNGAGKTTLLKTITRLSKQTSGEIQLFNSQNNQELTTALERTGSVIETPVAYDQLSATENLNYYCKLRGIVGKNDVADVLKIVGLENTDKKTFGKFSLGMKQKLGIAIALISKPDLLILDEPINGLDPIAIVEFRQLLLDLNTEHNITIIISSHILSELFHVANRFGIIHEGHILKEITKHEFHEVCQAVLQLELDDAVTASRILQEQFNCDFKVVSQTEINIYQYDGDPAEINAALVTAGIRLSSIHSSETDLETYFTQLIQEHSLTTQGGTTHA